MMAMRFGSAAVLLAAMVAATPATAGKRDNSLRVADEQVLDNVDPYFNSVRIGVILSHQVWDTLIYRDPDSGEYKGQLAASWKWIDDKTLEVDLRRGVKFHNGAELGADDVVYTLNFVSKRENNVSTQSNVDWIERAEKLGPHKVRILTRAPFPAAIEYLAGPIVIHPHAYYEKVGPMGMNEKPIGTGPYRIVEHALGKHLRLARNPDYFKDSPKPQPKIDTIELRFIPDRQTQVAEMLSGGLDLIKNVAPDQAKQLRMVPSLQVVSAEIMRYACAISECARRSCTRSTAPPWSSRWWAKVPGCCTSHASRRSSVASTRRRRAMPMIPQKPSSC
jgi:peptide/nickel transport system substrate-binding protein